VHLSHATLAPNKKGKRKKEHLARVHLSHATLALQPFQFRHDFEGEHVLDAERRKPASACLFSGDIALFG